MNQNLRSTLGTASVGLALLFVSSLALVGHRAPADPAARLLAVSGVVPVKDAGPFVHIGSNRTHVWTMLGRPGSILPDGTWLYPEFGAKGSAARGTLVVRFDQARVNQLSLVTPAVATAMLNAPASRQATTLITQR